jgi:hypothetical protein
VSPVKYDVHTSILLYSFIIYWLGHLISFYPTTPSAIKCFKLYFGLFIYILLSLDCTVLCCYIPIDIATCLVHDNSESMKEGA